MVREILDVEFHEIREIWQRCTALYRCDVSFNISAETRVRVDSISFLVRTLGNPAARYSGVNVIWKKKPR